MERGLLWLPLLIFFFWLAWSGWNEYQKVEAYRLWAEPFDRAKYDIYAVLGQKGSDLTWGVPTRKGPVNLEGFSLRDVEAIRLLVNGQPVSWEAPPGKGRAVLELFCINREQPICIPFTEPPLAAKWAQHLQQELNLLKTG
jgi:hypothetical protein